MRARHFLLLAPLLVACRGATEITVEVTTDLDCRDHPATSIAVGPLQGLTTRPATTTSSQCGANGSVGTLVIVPSGSNDEEVAFQVVTGVGIDPEKCSDPKNAAQCIFARRALRFIPHESLRVKVPMRSDCKGVKCDDSFTCLHGACVPATIVDSTKCGGAGCDDTVLGSGGVDGGITDAGADADAAAPPGNVLSLALGMHHSCALMKNHAVLCWGGNDKGQIGIGQDGGTASTPTQVPGLGVVVGLSAFSETHTCALMDDGTVKCWGGACCGQLGPYLVTQPLPVPVTGFTGGGAIAAGRAHTCALGQDGTTVSCWGTYAGAPLPITTVPGVSGAVDTLGSGDNLVVLGMKDGTVRVTGTNLFGQLGLGNADLTATLDAAVPVPNVSGVTSVANGNSFVIATLADGGVVAWGESAGRQLGLDDFNVHPSPTLITSLAGLHGFALGDEHGCALDPGGEVMCWGDGSAGQLGPKAQSSAVPVDVGIKAVKVYAGWYHNCALTPAGDVVCWGANDSGQLGDGTTGNRPVPVKVVGL